MGVNTNDGPLPDFDIYLIPVLIFDLLGVQ